MNSILNLGKYLYAIPFAVFGIFHFMYAEGMKGMAFGSSILVYITGAALIAATISMIIGKMDKLAAVLLAVFLLLTAFLVHLNSAMAGDAGSFLKDLSLAGAALMYAGSVAKDNAVIG
jgi:putative oxidoreductase